MQGHVLIMVGHVVNGIHDWLVIQVVAIGTHSFMPCCWPLDVFRAQTSAKPSGYSLTKGLARGFTPETSTNYFTTC